VVSRRCRRLRLTLGVAYHDRKQIDWRQGGGRPSNADPAGARAGAKTRAIRGKSRPPGGGEGPLRHVASEPLPRTGRTESSGRGKERHARIPFVEALQVSRATDLSVHFSGRQDVSLETKRKKLTVFFSDIKDFTQITEDLQAEDLAGLLNEYFTEMSSIALEHGATIDKFIGDAMLMFFGDPESKGVEEDARACVRMAIAMQRRMKDLQEDWRDRGYEHPFRMRIGINTGFCNVGNFGSKDRMDYTIIGGEVNLAARLESQADPDGILLSYETYAVVRDMVDAEERPSIEAKGIRREIRPFALTNFFERSEEDRYIRCDRDGLSIRIDLNKLSDEDRQQAEEMLARLQR
jgi:class 3 adenylate cyclase